MIFIYVLFFAILNLLIFSYLTKKMLLGVKMKIGLIALLIIIVVLHFLDFWRTSIPDQHFYHLVIFSAVLFIFHFGSKFPILAMKKINPKFENHLAFSGFNFMRFYVVYVLVYLYQLIYLLH